MLSKKEKLISLIYNAVFSAPLPEDFPSALTDEEGTILLHASKIHDLAHIVAFALKNNKIEVSSELNAKFQKYLFMSVFRSEKLQYELNRISDIFEQEKIPFIPLKGAVLRPYYPEPWLRTSCDIDLFVSEEDLAAAEKAVVEKAGYRVHGQWKGERSFFSVDGIHLELHFYDEADEEEGLIFREIFDYASPEPGFQYRMHTEWEFFYAHHMLHMSKHFSHGGCGIRPFIDLALMCDKILLDDKKKKAYLERYGLTVFSNAAELLASVWFGEEEHTSLTKQMQDYLLGAGIYGSVENRIALEKSGKSKQLSGFFQHVWLPYDVIKHQFSVLQRHKWLLPVFQMKRWFHLIFCGGLKRSMHHIRENLNVSDDRIKLVSELMERLELS